MVENLRGDLEKYRYLPRILSTDPVFKTALRTPGDGAAIAAANAELVRAASTAGASDVYLMDVAGLTLAASNWDLDKSFVGRNFRYRPYFQQAMEGRLGRYFALGTTSGERGYYFAYPIRDERNPDQYPVAGVIVVKLTVDHHEQQWKATDSDIVVLDEMGVVFMSSRDEWHFKTLGTVPPEDLAALRAGRRYADAELGTVAAELTESGGREQLSVLARNGSDRRGREDFLTVRQEMPDAGWHVLLLSRTDAVQTQMQTSVAVAAAALLSLTLAGAALYQRRKRLAERIAVQERANADLEVRVTERTEELERANADLHREVVDRKRAEETVRQTQASLVQATKLAALGQLSAGLSHELNQPLAAIRSYADNAASFIARGRAENAGKNLTEISGLTDRMARIIRNLRTYARDEPVDLRPVPVQVALDEALTLLHRRVEGEAVTVIRDVPDAEVRVMAGAVRLQQVFVNLLSNALDAMDGCADKRITVTLSEREDGRKAVISVADTGPGFSSGQVEKLFDPFYSTKEVGEGMGLGLSITFGLVSQFGGTIQAKNGEAGGAVFTLALKCAAEPVEAVA